MPSSSAETPVRSAVADLRPPALLMEPERLSLATFLQNLAVLFRPSQKPLPHQAALFWSDVFVPGGLPWMRFAQSLIYHGLAIGVLWAAGRYLPRPAILQNPWLNAPVEVLPVTLDNPVLDTGRTPTKRSQEADPTLSRQTVISVPPQPDNRSQTIVTPPDIKLTHDVPLPNIVAWTPVPSPVPIAGLESQRKLIAPDATVIAPPPQLDATHRVLPSLPNAAPVAPAPEIELAAQRSIVAPESAVVAPPPTVDSSLHPLGALNIGHTEAVAPAPQLPLSEQRALPFGGAAPGTPQAVPPPPTLTQGGISGQSQGRMIALGIHPVEPTGPVTPPSGNRRGEFAATPQGKSSASGTPEIRAAATAASNAGGGADGGHSSKDLPSGLYVGASPVPGAGVGPSANRPDPASTIASANVPAITVTAPRDPNRRPAHLVDRPANGVERQVFGDRRFYSMALNMPNLNSASGSWIIRFAELKDHSEGELLPPVATHKVDPSYPTELRRRNIEGTVTLYAVIHGDGSVSDIRVIDGAGDDLDRYASEALQRWRFLPALKNGKPVALEAMVAIPFRLHGL
jgi:TonB family protein